MKIVAAILLGLSVVAASTVAVPAQTAVLAHKGAELDGELQATLDSGKNHDGDTFTLVEKDTFFHKNPALKGATIEGHLEGVSAAGPRHKATMNIIFDDVKMPDGTVAPLHVTVTSLKEFEPRTHHIRDVAVIVGGAVAGHMVSKHTGKKGGTFAGAAAGFALASTMKSNIVVKRRTLVRLRLNEDVLPGSASAT